MSQTTRRGQYTYRLYTTVRNWQAAENHCKNSHEFGHLVWITNAAENTFVKNFVASEEVWIGLKVDREPYYWSSGAPYAYENFLDGEPNQLCLNWAGYGYGCEGCSIMKESGVWNDLLCAQPHPFVCRYPDVCGGLEFNNPLVCGGVGTCSAPNACICPSGYYDEGGKTCTPCEEGSHCVNPKVTAFCPPGAWSDTHTVNVTDCYPCPAYHKCRDGVKTDCSKPAIAPQFPFNSDTGHSTCNTCPEHYYLAYSGDPSIIECILCPAGKKCDGNGVAMVCTGNKYAAREGQKECDTCPTGSYTTDDHMMCLKCQYPGEHCPDGNNRYTCDPGKYFHSGDKTCKNCPPGKVCQHGYQFECPKGHYVYEMENRCVLCPVGFYCPGDSKAYLCTQEKYGNIGGLSECKVCTAGHYTNNTHTLCTECIPNAYCPDGVLIIICTEGEYLSVSDAACFPCPEGFYCQAVERQACTAGFFANETGLTACFKCPAGTAHNKVAQTSIDDCIPCPAGSYSSEEASASCLQCPAGYWSNMTGLTSVDDCIPCIPGTFSTQLGANNISACAKCPAGSINNAYASTSCELCPVGQYASNPGSTSCDNCAAGSYADQEGTSECILCPPGTYNEFSRSTSESACIRCASGASPYYGATSPSVCAICEPGFRVSGSSCYPCDAGSFSTESNALACTTCNEGYFLPRQGASTDECGPCAPGSYASERGSAQCTLCPVGTSSNSTAAVSISTCEACPPGFHASVRGSTECRPCNSGTYSGEGQQFCSPCPRGTISATPMATSCENCLPGTYTDYQGGTVCILCPAGTYNPNNGSTTPDDCIPCPIGTYSPTVATTQLEHCTTCPAGSFCNEVGMSRPNLCPKGTYSSVVGSITVNDCIKCPAGTFSGMDGAGSVSACESCPLGRYSSTPGIMSDADCIQCPPGTFSTVIRATDASVCQLCPRGEYSSIPTLDCTKCPTATYNDQEGATNSSSCIPCASHQITSAVGSPSSSSCFSCPDGWYIDQSTWKCAPCPLGTYFDIYAQPSNVRRSIASCVPCGTGYYQPKEAQIGAGACQMCGQGTYAPLEKNSACTPCGKGYYSNLTAASFFEECTPCPRGTWSEVLIANSSDVCIYCSPGTAQNITGAPSPQYCKLCPVGTKSTEIGSFNCTPCAANEQCLTVGSSFEIGLNTVTDESSSIFDPKSIQSIMIANYETLKYAIPFGLIGLFLICLGCCFCFVLILLRKHVARFLVKIDFFLATKHSVKVGESRVKQPTILGGILSLVIALAFIGLFASILIAFIGDNKMVLETFVLENTKNIAGRFEFKTLITGRHKVCEATIAVIGFQIVKSEWSCESGVHFEEAGMPVEGCLCSYSCLDCLPHGNEHRVVFDFAKGHMMTQSILYEVEVPHYIPDKFYIVNGSMTAGSAVFTGDGFPHTFSFTMNNAKYIATSSLGIFYEMLGYKESTVTTGYTIHLSSKTSGSSQPNNDEFVLQRGMQVVFEIDRAFGTVLSEEVLRQNLMTFLAQIMTVFSLLITVSTIVQKVVESIRGLFRKNGANKVVPLEAMMVGVASGALEAHSDDYELTRVQSADNAGEDDGVESQLEDLSSINESEIDVDEE